MKSGLSRPAGLIVLVSYIFLPNRQSVHPLLRYALANEQRHLGAIFIDIAKAFDKVWHESFLY